ncbi:MAG: ABC transporter permease [Planctomycetota bacterium]|nr:ABC transporter permease [Planctomycetota bacterium]
MNLRTLIARGLRFHWRSHLAVGAGALVATAVLVGALVVGDSVRYSLRQMALERLGRTESALVATEGTFRAALARDLEEAAPDTMFAAVLQVRGVAAREDGTARINQVQVLGVDEKFWELAAARAPFAAGAAGGVAVNERTARQLGIGMGDALLLRIEKPSAVPLDAPLSGQEDTSPAVHVTVKAIAGAENFGRFGLQANQVPPFNIFVDRTWLERQLGLASRANTVLAGPAKSGGRIEPGLPNAILKAKWTLADAELDLRALPDNRGIELLSKRVFLDPAVAPAAASERDATGILTYFVNELRVGEQATPYSMVTAVGPLTTGQERGTLSLTAVLPSDMADDEIVINSWLAEDLGAKPGDTLDMIYYVIGPVKRLETASAKFRIRAVVPMEGAAADRTLMPDFPGIADVENCRDLKPGAPVDLKKVRKKDEAYWNQYRGTPKAFVTLAAGQKMWANRFGNLTAIRFPEGEGPPDALESRLQSRLDPREFGLYFQPVRERALAAVENATDLGGLFLGLSIFLVAAAAILAGLLFALGVQERTEETGTLLALGIPRRQVRMLYLAEGACVAVAAGIVGAAAGLVYTKAMLVGLSTVWQGAVGSSDLRFHAEPLSVAIGGVGGIVVALGTILLAIRRQARAPARELLAAGAEAELNLAAPRRGRVWLGMAVAAVSGAAAVMLLPLAKGAAGEKAAGVFFGVGSLLLVGLLSAYHSLLLSLAFGSDRKPLDLAALAMRNVARRRGRSLATVAILASGVFLVIAVGAFYQGPQANSAARASGTGGFALFGEASLPVVADLNTAEGRRAFALPVAFKNEVRFVPLRVHQGDDASCLNLNRPQQPRVVGVQPEEFASRGAFSFAATTAQTPGESPWMLLKRSPGEAAVPAIADQTTLEWSLQKSVGDTLDYTDERGRTFCVRIVGAIENSVLQGSLIISEEAFIEKFPSESGYRMFLVDAPPEQAAEVARTLSQQMSDVGLAVMTTSERLAEFNAVQNTYVAIFQVLGGLGLVLGSVGMGVVVMRNIMERRSELALLRAVGFPVRSLYRMILWEHWLLLVLGLGAGLAAAILAVWPALRSSGGTIPYLLLAVLVAAVLASGMLWTLLAARLALKGPLLAALRNE